MSPLDSGAQRGIVPTIMQAFETVYERLNPVDMLTPKSLGEGLLLAFDGYDRGARPLPTLLYLIEEYRAIPSFGGDPVFMLDLDDTRGLWHRRPERNFEKTATTNSYGPDHPFILPSSVDRAPAIVTTTFIHHYFLSTTIDHDVLITGETSGASRPFWYAKPKTRAALADPITPRHLVEMNQVSRLVWHVPDAHTPGAFIQYWKLSGETYALQAGLELKGLSVRDFLRFMAADKTIIPVS